MHKVSTRIRTAVAGLIVIVALACGVTALKILITTCDTAPIAVAQINTSQENRDRWNMGFKKEGTILRILEKTPDDKEAQKVAAFNSVENIRENFVHIGNPKADAWIDAIVKMVRGFFNIPDGDTLNADSVQRALSDKDVKITKDQAEEFKRLVEKGPDK